MIKRKNEIFIDTGENSQITLTGYHWHNAILNWSIHGKGTKGSPIYSITIEVLRFKFNWHNYGKPF